MDARDHYRRLRREHPTFAAERVLAWARHEAECDAIAREIDWEFGGAGPLIGTLDDGTQIAVYADEETYDWGDCEPTDEERERLEVIGVGVRAGEGEDDLMTVWGVGYLHGDATREAISCAIECGFLTLARSERSERERGDGGVTGAVFGR